MKEREEEHKILGPTGIKMFNWVKMKPVGARIPAEYKRMGVLQTTVYN